jgi:hypothetical protein
MAIPLDVNALFALASAEATSVPPEYQATVDDFIDVVGCVLGIVLSERQIDWLRSRAMQALSQPDEGEAQIIESSVRAFQGVKAADAQVRHVWRQQNQAAFVQRIGQTQNALCQTLREWHTEAQKILAACHPPLTREAAESWAELSTCAVLIAQGKEPGTAAPQNLEAMIAQLARDYPALPSRQQLWIAFAPITLYEIRRSWPTLSVEQREVLRGQLAAQFGVQPAQPADPYQAPVTSAAVTPRPPARTRPASTWDRFRQEDTSVEGLQRQWSEAQAAGDQQKASELQLKIQTALQQAAQASAMLTNIASMKHSMMMAVANNLKA